MQFRYVVTGLAVVMSNAASGFSRVDSGKIAVARSYGAATLQVFWKIRAPNSNKKTLPLFSGLAGSSIT